MERWCHFAIGWFESFFTPCAVYCVLVHIGAEGILPSQSRGLVHIETHAQVVLPSEVHQSPVDLFQRIRPDARSSIIGPPWLGT